MKTKIKPFIKMKVFNPSWTWDNIHIEPKTDEDMTIWFELNPTPQIWPIAGVRR